MAVDPDLLELFPFQATLKPPASQNRYGEYTYDAVGNLTPRCHLKFTGRQVTDSKGLTRTEEGQCILDDAYPIDTRWTLDIPTPGGPRRVDIIGVSTSIDEGGWHHTTVSFG